MTQKSTNLVSSAKVYYDNKYSEFTTFFRIPFKQGEELHPIDRTGYWMDIIGAWSKTLILALETRMDSCVAMLFRNRNNVVKSNKYEVIFRKANGRLHAFNHPSFQAMEDMVKALQFGEWKSVITNKLGVRQLQKALYWISEEDRKDHGAFSFGELISCLDELTL